MYNGVLLQFLYHSEAHTI